MKQSKLWLKAVICFLLHRLCMWLPLLHMHLAVHLIVSSRKQFLLQLEQDFKIAVTLCWMDKKLRGYFKLDETYINIWLWIAASMFFRLAPSQSRCDRTKDRGCDSSWRQFSKRFFSAKTTFLHQVLRPSMRICRWERSRINGCLNCWL